MAKARISCDVQSVIGQVHPFIYGHFIEHLHECIYNGLWAEMLRNRKFAGHDQAPGGRPVAEQYGIPYPWHAVNRTSGTRFSHDNTIYYNGLQSQRIDIIEADGQAHGVAQGGIALEKGRTYDVRLVLSQEGMAGPVTVRLGHGATIYAQHVIPRVSPEWETYTFTFTSDHDDDQAEFSVVFDTPGRLWIGAASLMPADNIMGWRKDVIELVRALRPPIVRYPGGNFVSGYHWEDGIGDRDSRPIRFDYAWNVWEPNDVGIDEFMQLCDLIECEPYISVNAGNGTAEEAAAWVEYCNGAPNTVYGAKRAANGHPEPYGIRYWGIGNEMYGNWQIAHCDPETFGRRHVVFARAMRAVDPDIILLAVGDMPDQPGLWLETVTDLAGEYTDLMTVHHYTGVPSELSQAEKDAVAVAAPDHIATLLLETRRILDERGPGGHPITISFDEWNIAHRGTGGRQNYALRDGLYAAGMFNVFQHQCTSVTMANIAQLVNLLGVIETSPTAAYGTPIYHVFKLYRDQCGDTAVETAVQGPTFDLSPLGNIPAMPQVPYLSASGTIDRSQGTLSLAVVNRHAQESIPATIDIQGASPGGEAHVWEINGPGMDTRNTFDAPDLVTITDKGTLVIQEPLAYEFPAHSVSLLVIPLR